MQLSDKELVDEVRNRLARTRMAMEEIKEVNNSLIIMNEKLRQSEALKSNFLSNIRNEVNNPLNSIMGLATQIIWGLDDDHPLSQLAEGIRDEAQNLNFQLANIITAAELESGDYVANLSLVNITGMMEGVVSSFLPLITRKRLKVKWVGDVSGNIRFVSDAEKLESLFGNVLDNAIKFSNDSSDIVLDASCSDEELCVSIRDYGIGIAKKDQKRIFDRFLQLDSGSTRAHRGHGLGLSIVNALVELLNGSIQVESEPGKGTCVFVRFPKIELPDRMEMFSDEGNLLIFGQDDDH